MRRFAGIAGIGMFLLSGASAVAQTPVGPVPQASHAPSGADAGLAASAGEQGIVRFAAPSPTQMGFLVFPDGHVYRVVEEPTNSTVPGGNESSHDTCKELVEAENPWKARFEVRGRIHTDAIAVSQSTRDVAIIGTVQDATGFRRARLGVQGTVGDNVDWVSEFDFAGGNISFKDVFVEVKELPYVRRIRVGHMSEPFSLEGYTNSNYFTFVERSPIMSLDPARNWGVGFFSYTDDERMTFSGGAFRSGTSNSSGDDITNEGDWACTFRLTGLPWYDAASGGRYLMHVGAVFSQRFAHNDTVTISQGPQSNLLSVADNPGSPFTPSLSIPAEQWQLYNAQWATVLGPLSFQAEWTGASIAQIGGGPVFLHGFYAMASYFLTGENRDYVTKDGTFGMTKVRSPFVCLHDKKFGTGPGAWELTARVDWEDFSSSNLKPPNVGNRLAEFTAGVNWYLNDYTRIMFNYVHAVPVVPGAGPSYADEFVVRTAIFW
jgi:phosphate-selective porin OprO/OprP